MKFMSRKVHLCGSAFVIEIIVDLFSAFLASFPAGNWAGNTGNFLAFANLFSLSSSWLITDQGNPGQSLGMVTVSNKFYPVRTLASYTQKIFYTA